MKLMSAIGNASVLDARYLNMKKKWIYCIWMSCGAMLAILGLAHAVNVYRASGTYDWIFFSAIFLFACGVYVTIQSFLDIRREMKRQPKKGTGPKAEKKIKNDSENGKSLIPKDAQTQSEVKKLDK